MNDVTKCFPYWDIGKTLIITISSNLTLNQLVIRFKLWLIIAFYSKQYFSFYLWAWCPCHNCICIIVYIWGHNMISLCNPDVNGGKFKVTCSKWCHHNQNKQMLQLTIINHNDRGINGKLSNWTTAHSDIRSFLDNCPKFIYQSSRYWCNHLDSWDIQKQFVKHGQNDRQ